MRDSPGHIPPPTSSSNPPTLGFTGGGGGSGPPAPQQQPQSNLSIFSADSEYIRNFLSSVPAVFPVSPGAMLAELTGYAPLSPSHGYHMSLHSSPARRSPSPHRTSFPSPGYLSLIPRIGSGSNKHVYAPILPSRAYDCTPIPSPPPLHDSQHTSSILSLAGTFSPVRRQSQDFAKDMTIEENLEQSGTSNVLASSSFGLNSSGGGLLEDPGSPIQTEFGDESVMQLTAIGGEYQDNSENLISKTEQSTNFTTGNKKQDKKNKQKNKAPENSSTICTSNPTILSVPGEITDQKKSSSLKPKLASCEITPVEENAKQVADKLSKGCNCERNCFKDLDPVMVFSHRKSISKLSKVEHDMYLMGVMSATLRNPSLTSKKKERMRNRNKYIYKGTEVCQEAYIYLENVSTHHLKSIRLHTTRNGIVKRTFKIDCHKEENKTENNQSKEVNDKYRVSLAPGTAKTIFVKSNNETEYTTSLTIKNQDEKIFIKRNPDSRTLNLRKKFKIK